MEEGADVMEEDFEGSLMDAALIGAAQRVEHYEIAAYGTVCAFAQELGETEQASLLPKGLQSSRRVLDSRSPFTHPSAVPSSGRRSLVQFDNSHRRPLYAAHQHADHPEVAT